MANYRWASLKLNGLNMQDIQLNLSAKNGIIKTQQSAKEFYQGSYNGSLSVDMRNNKPALRLNEQIDHVQVEPLLKDIKGEARMSGTVDASAQLQGQGSNTENLNPRSMGPSVFCLKIV